MEFDNTSENNQEQEQSLQQPLLLNQEDDEDIVQEEQIQKQIPYYRTHIRDSLEIYEQQMNKNKMRKIELNDVQKMVIFNMLQLGFTIEQAVIITDLSNVTSIEQILDYIESNPKLIDHPFIRYDQNDYLASKFSKSILCAKCDRKKELHRYEYCKNIEIEDKDDDYMNDLIQFIRKNSKIQQEQSEGQRNSLENRIENQSDKNISRSFEKDIKIIGEQNDQLFQTLDENHINQLKKLRISSQIIFKACQVCYEEFENRNIIQYENQSHEICITCFKSYLSECIQTGKVLNIICPHCSQKLKFKFIQKVLDANTFAKYRQQILDQLISIDPYLRWCPNVRCGQLVNLKAKFKRKVQCEKCQTSLCTECNREYHKGSCNSIFQKEIKQWEDNTDIQRCKVCKTIVEKISGCNHMTCKVCDFEWCWLCGKRYDKYHFFYLNPFGCASLQFKSIVGWKLILYKTLIFITALFLIPFLFIFFLPIYFCNYFYQKVKYQNWIIKCIVMVFFFIVGLIAQPIADVIFFICLIPGLIYMLCKRRQDKQIQLAKSQQKLKNQIVKNLGIEPEDLA